MPAAEGKNWIDKLRLKFIAFHLIGTLAIGFAISLISSAILTHLFDFSPWAFALIFPIVMIICLWIKPSWKISEVDIARFLNQKYPNLEESTGLLLKNSEELTSLQLLQLRKINQVLTTIQQPKEPFKKLYMGFGILLAGLLISFSITKISPIEKSNGTTKTTVNGPSQINENIPKTISDFEVVINPPDYTGKAVRHLKQFNIQVENGAQITWKIRANTKVSALQIIFNEKETFNLRAINAESTSFSFTKTLEKSGFYQLLVDGKKSDLYQIDVVPDLPVNIKINKPPPHTTIDIGQPQKVNFSALLTDDYGIEDAYISATMASGKGEGVSFTEKKLDFGLQFHGKKSILLSKQLDLKSLGMKPGDELYFFIKAKDNHGQTSRTDIYFVSIVDTTELMSLSGLTSGVSLVPEYFRSQRQIIIDTEKLLKEQATLSTAVFKTRSNELGIDQKLLRLRYGKFLGEEDETEIGGDHQDGDGHDHGKGEEKFGDVTAIMDKYAHKHDVAEDATFFEPALKAQLKNVLTEMWKSELRLRTYLPQEALPFEYKALRLLKDLQQKSRAYVAKTTVKKAALKPEKRLTGELDKINQPVQKMSFEETDSRTAQLKKALSILETKKSGGKTNVVDQIVLKETEKYLTTAAAERPGIYLPALISLTKLSTGNSGSIKDIEKVQRALQKMMQIEYAKPQSQRTIQASSLYQGYFNQLKKEKYR